MATYDHGGMPPRKPPETGRPSAEAAGEPAERQEGAVGALPGVVNDLPEVAPHEWIYLMS